MIPIFDFGAIKTIVSVYAKGIIGMFVPAAIIETIGILIGISIISTGGKAGNMKVIIINGPMGVGKTATGKYIAENNPGTAFIDGDWCMDIHPFIGNRETKAMAIDNILHMIGNYQKCSECKMVVLAWLMDDQWVLQSIMDGLSALQTDVKSVTLTCDRETLTRRWKSDHNCEWRTNQWLEVSLKSLPYFSSMKDAIDTSDSAVDQIAGVIMGEGRS